MYVLDFFSSLSPSRNPPPLPLPPLRARGLHHPLPRSELLPCKNPPGSWDRAWAEGEAAPLLCRAAAPPAPLAQAGGFGFASFALNCFKTFLLFFFFLLSFISHFASYPCSSCGYNKGSNCRKKTKHGNLFCSLLFASSFLLLGLSEFILRLFWFFFFFWEQQSYPLHRWLVFFQLYWLQLLPLILLLLKLYLSYSWFLSLTLPY